VRGQGDSPVDAVCTFPPSGRARRTVSASVVWWPDGPGPATNADGLGNVHLRITWGFSAPGGGEKFGIGPAMPGGAKTTRITAVSHATGRVDVSPAAEEGV
jgi:hypothetical protein